MKTAAENLYAQIEARVLEGRMASVERLPCETAAKPERLALRKDVEILRGNLGILFTNPADPHSGRARAP